MKAFSNRNQLDPAILNYAILGLLAVLYVPLLLHWVHGWLVTSTISIQHEYFSHGRIGLPFAAYIVWQQRDRWAALPDQTNIMGFVVLGLAAIGYLSPLPDWVNLSFPLRLLGIGLVLKGQPGLRLCTVPLLLVFLATPTQLPYLIEPYILPLQRFITGAAGFILVQFGVDVYIQQIYLFVNGNFSRPVEVAPHCAGLKMLFTSLYVGLMLLYWTGVGSSRLKSGLFLIGIVFVSVIANILRNAALTYFHGTGKDAAFDWLHESWGGDLYSALSLVVLIGLLQVIDRAIPTPAPLPATPTKSVPPLAD